MRNGNGGSRTKGAVSPTDVRVYLMVIRMNAFDDTEKPNVVLWSRVLRGVYYVDAMDWRGRVRLR